MEIMGATALASFNAQLIDLEVAAAEIREVRLDPFFMGKFEITQLQWQALTVGIRHCPNRPWSLLVG